MAHYTTESLMRLGMKFTLQMGEFDRIIATMKNYFESYEAGAMLGGEVMDEILERIDIEANDFAGLVIEEYSDDSVAVYHTARTFLLGILFEYIGHSNLEPDQFVKLITNRE